jgi:predicted acetyltransferase
MAQLVAPNAKFQSSWLEASAEFDSARQDGAGADGWSLDELKGPQGFARFVNALLNDALPENPRKPGYVLCTYLWIVDGGTFLGSLAIRHELNEFLLNEGGHIGYSVRPFGVTRWRWTHLSKATLLV